MKPLVLHWALLSEVDSAVFVWLQPQLVIQNLLFFVIPTHAKLHWCIPWSEKKVPHFSKITLLMYFLLLGILC